MVCFVLFPKIQAEGTKGLQIMEHQRTTFVKQLKLGKVRIGVVELLWVYSLSLATCVLQTLHRKYSILSRSMSANVRRYGSW